jgi:hypothetical protein
VVSVAVTPLTAAIPVTGTQQFIATATYRDGSSRDVTASSSWTSGTPAVATVSSTSGSATGVASGASIISAAFGGMSGSATLTVNAAISVSFVVTPGRASLPVTGTQQYTAIETFSDGTTIDRTVGSTWSATDLVGVGIATIGANTGLATGNVVGQSTIKAIFGTKISTATLTVTAATSVSFVVTPGRASMPISGTQQFIAIETFSDGTTIDRTVASTWSATDLVGVGIATIGANTGIATGNSAGQSTIKAIFGLKTATTAVLTVTAATSKSFVVTPALASIPVTGTQKFTAIETFSDGTTIDRTAASTWSSPDLVGVGVATVGVNTGLATGLTVGQSTITATFGLKVATANLTVTAATSKSFVVTPTLASIPVTGTQQYTAIETFSDGTTFDRTAASTWSATDLVGVGVATIGANTGLATGNVVGQSTIKAVFGLKTATTAVLTVNAATSKSFVVTPALASTPVTGTQQFAAIETFSDGSIFDRTTASTWSATDVAPGVGVATVGANTGLATGNVVGQSTIKAIFGLKTATTATLTVNAATSKSFVVTPALVSLPITGTQKYTAIETFSDGTTIDRTAASTWTSPDLSGGPGVATILPTGVATAKVLGQSTITATFGLKVATAVMTVTAATSTSFVVTPALATIPVTGTQQFTAIETFSDGTTIDSTAASTWSATDVAPAIGVAVIGLNTGLATGNVVGQSTIKAVFGLQTATTATLTVTAATSKSFTVKPATATIGVAGGTQQFNAIEIFSDGSTIDRTIASTWTSVDLVGTGVSTIGLNTGLASGKALGQSTITATFGLQTATAVLTVTAPNPGSAGSGPDLKTVAPHGIIAYNAITNSAGPSHIYGDVALTQPGPGGTIASVTGPGTNDGGVAPLLTSSIVTDSYSVPSTPGLITAADNGTPAKIAALPQLLLDLRAVYDDLFSRAAPVTALTTPASAAGVSGGTFPAAAPDLSGYILSPGIFTTSGTYGLSNTLGPLVLDAGGNPDAVFIIRSTAVGPSGLTSTTGSVVLQNGAQSKNVFWLLDNATIGAGTFFRGTVVTGHAITLLAHANVEGRMLAGALGLVSGAITLTDTNIITVPK